METGYSQDTYAVTAELFYCSGHGINRRKWPVLHLLCGAEMLYCVSMGEKDCLIGNGITNLVIVFY